MLRSILFAGFLFVRFENVSFGTVITTTASGWPTFFFFVNGTRFLFNHLFVATIVSISLVRCSTSLMHRRTNIVHRKLHKIYNYNFHAHEHNQLEAFQQQ